MPLPTGTISMSQVNTELQKTSTATISLNDTNVRALAEKVSGTISMNDLRGKTYGQVVTLTGAGKYDGQIIGSSKSMNIDGVSEGHIGTITNGYITSEDVTIRGVYYYSQTRLCYLDAKSTNLYRLRNKTFRINNSFNVIFSGGVESPAVDARYMSSSISVSNDNLKAILQNGGTITMVLLP